MSIEIQAIPALKDNYIWLIKNPKNRAALCVDPGESTPVLQQLKQQDLTLCAILITHHHWDHTDGVVSLVEQTGCEVYGPAKEMIPSVTHDVQQDEVLSFDEVGIQFRVIETPGHTLGHVCYYGNASLFCGDTLFTCGCGRVFEGTAQQMLHSLEQLKSLPDKTQIYCAHEYTVRNCQFAEMVEPKNLLIKKRLSESLKLRQSNLPTVPALLSLEKETNPFLRCEVGGVREAVSQYAGRQVSEPVEVFKELRSWKDGF